MLKTVLRIFIALVIVTLIGVTGLYLYNKNHTYLNGEEEVGNTTGNIYNGGLFCEQDGKIYFSNDYDGSSLYVMSSFCTNSKKLSADIPAFINADENYIYYIRANDTKENSKTGFLVFKNNGVFRINQNGTNLKAITGDPGAYLVLKGNQLFFQKYQVDTNFNLVRYQIDGTGERLLVAEEVIPFAISDTGLLYTGYSKDHNINMLDLLSYTTHMKYKGSYLYPMVVGDYIYYINIEDDYKLYRMNIDGSEPTKLVNKRCSTYNITNTGKFLYYQVDNGKSNGVYSMNLSQLGKVTLLQKGDYKQISVTEQYVFFKDYDNTNTYVVQSEGGTIVNTLDSLLAPK